MVLWHINLWNFSYFYLLRENQWRYSETEGTSGFRASNMTSSQSPRNFYAAGDVYLRVRYSVYLGGRSILIWTDFPKCPSSIVLSERITPRAGIRSVRTGSDPWTDTEPEVIRSTTEPSFLTSVRSFKAVRTDIIGTEQRSEPTDVESGFLYVRTEPIGKMVPSTEPNRLST